ncbi:Acyl carrier protein [bioreactor metagenome]|uniref:Acyl carrier protein n=1 Tax=bioreactor metagenome TaxID=1076179 RepID=A0A645HRT0_9ZZZZ
MTVNRTEIEQQVSAAVATVAGVGTESVEAGSDLVADLSLDSLAMYELVIDLEERYGLRISDEDLDRIHTVSDIVDYIDRSIDA